MAELQEPEVPKESMFHPDNVQAYTLLTLLQMREFLGIIASNLSEEADAELDHLEREFHSKGRLLYPPPFLSNGE